MNCEYCNLTLRQGDLVHGIKHGSLASSGFIPAKDAAVTILCNDCSREIYSLVYASLDKEQTAYTVIFNMYNELTILMKNGYKLIQSIAKLPKADQQALQHLIAISKSSR
jgi:hypothetical protein